MLVVYDILCSYRVIIQFVWNIESCTQDVLFVFQMNQPLLLSRYLQSFRSYKNSSSVGFRFFRHWGLFRLFRTDIVIIWNLSREFYNRLLFGRQFGGCSVACKIAIGIHLIKLKHRVDFLIAVGQRHSLGQPVAVVVICIVEFYREISVSYSPLISVYFEICTTVICPVRKVSVRIIVVLAYAHKRVCWVARRFIGYDFSFLNT